ncbi:phage tail protein [Sphingomonas sp.]|uniref:phage tail protein n=1 Tax=Sphingomonas sp. TaxID=28214 RepID=UPI003BA8B7F5
MAEYYVGEIRLFAFNRYAPANFLPCDGRSLRVSDYQVLFTLIGTTYGGDGVTTFNLPDLRGRSPVHLGQLTGGSTYALGTKAGVEQVQLTSATVPAHFHTVCATKGSASSLTPGATVAPGDVGANFYYCTESQPGTVFQTNVETVSIDGGDNQPHPNIQPSLVLAYAIAFQGLYPDFNN